MTAAVSVAISSCGDCPFAVAPEVEIDDWLCSAIEGAQGTRILGGGPDFQPWGPPPSWCPLRRVDLLVTLRRGDPCQRLPVVHSMLGLRDGGLP